MVSAGLARAWHRKSRQHHCSDVPASFSYSFLSAFFIVLQASATYPAFKECTYHRTPFLRPAPVVLIGIDKQFSRNTAHYGGVKGSHCLVGKGMRKSFAMNAEDGGVPFIYEGGS